MENFVGREEFKMYVEKVESEQREQNRRLGVLDDAIKSIQSLAVEMGKMNITMAKMVDEQADQGKRLAVIEKKPVEKWEKVVYGLIGLIVASIGGYVLKQLGL